MAPHKPFHRCHCGTSPMICSRCNDAGGSWYSPGETETPVDDSASKLVVALETALSDYRWSLRPLCPNPCDTIGHQHFHTVAPRGRRRPGPGCERLYRRTKQTRRQRRDGNSPRRRCSIEHWARNRASLSILGTVDGAAHGPRSRDRGPACPRRPSLQHSDTSDWWSESVYWYPRIR